MKFAILLVASAVAIRLNQHAATTGTTASDEQEIAANDPNFNGSNDSNGSNGSNSSNGTATNEPICETNTWGEGAHAWTCEDCHAPDYSSGHGNCQNPQTLAYNHYSWSNDADGNRNSFQGFHPRYNPEGSATQ